MGLPEVNTKWAEDNETLLTVNCRLHTKRQGSSWTCPSPRQAELIWMQTSAYNIQIFNIYSELGRALDSLQKRFMAVFMSSECRYCMCVFICVISVYCTLLTKIKKQQCLTPDSMWKLCIQLCQILVWCITTVTERLFISFPLHLWHKQCRLLCDSCGITWHEQVSQSNCTCHKNAKTSWFSFLMFSF